MKGLGSGKQRTAKPTIKAGFRRPPAVPQVTCFQLQASDQLTWSLSHSRKMRLSALAHSGRSACRSGSYKGAMGCTTAGAGPGSREMRGLRHPCDVQRRVCGGGQPCNP